MSFFSYLRPKFKRRLMAGEVPEWLRKHNRRTYITAAVLSFPFWAKSSDFKHLKERARQLTRMTGIPHQVDHIVPINHPRVCGLTVPWNVQVITGRENGRKGNAWGDEPDCEQLELFHRPEVEQYELNI